MKFGIYSNLTRDVNGKESIRFAELLQKRDIPFSFCADLQVTGYPAEYLSNEALAKESDILLTFGGDGTVLHFAMYGAKYGKPILAINTGRMGFLTEAENSGYEDIIERILKKDYFIEKRGLLSATIGKKSFVALNEVVISRGAKTKIVYTELSINGCYVEGIRSDAIIVSTPSGSTAYSLSAGGPIVAPDVNGMIITPVAPYSIHGRPLVIGEDSRIDLKLISADPCAYLNVDGADVVEIYDGQAVRIEKAKETVSFIKLKDNSFYLQLSKKFNYFGDEKKER